MKATRENQMRSVEGDGGWRCPKGEPGLADDEVHVWRARLDRPEELSSLFGTLSSDERERAESFHASKDRERFVAAHGLLRSILASYAEGEPADLGFCFAPRGKPELVRESGGGHLRFNMSHSDELALYAVARGHRVGIDVEKVRADLHVTEIAKRAFSAREQSVLFALPDEARRAAFYNGWTRKEAYVKATGQGVFLPLDAFDVSLAPGKPAALLASRHDPDAPSRWSLLHLAPAPGYVGALAVEGCKWRLRRLVWPDTEAPGDE